MDDAKEPAVVYVIARWSELYEPPPKTGAGGRGPLNYVQWRAHPHVTTVLYQRLARHAGEDHGGIAAALGIFGKMCEMAAGEDRGPRREGTVYDHLHEPATLDALAEENWFPRPQVEHAVTALVRAEWVIALPFSEWLAKLRGTAGNGGKRRETAGNGGKRREVAEGSRTFPPKRNETETEQNVTEHNETKPKTSSAQEIPSASDSGGAPQGIDPPPMLVGGHKGVRKTTEMLLATLFKIRPPLISDTSARAKQARSDLTTISRIIDHVVNAPDRTEAKRQSRLLIALAETKQRSSLKNKLAGFVRSAKDRWGAWAGCKESRAGPARQAQIV